MQRRIALHAVQFVSLSAAEEVKTARAKCAYRGES
jgi:hypothetical protein